MPAGQFNQCNHYAQDSVLCDTCKYDREQLLADLLMVARRLRNRNWSLSPLSGDVNLHNSSSQWSAFCRIVDKFEPIGILRND